MHINSGINSLPVVYQHVPLVRTIFPESQSVNFGFERPLPDVPNGTIILDEYPDDILEDMKSKCFKIDVFMKMCKFCLH